MANISIVQNDITEKYNCTIRRNVLLLNKNEASYKLT